MDGTMVFVARLFGFLVTAIGILGAVAPRAFVAAVSLFQYPPVIYGAAVLRVVFGFALIRAARASRAPAVLRVLGALILIGGVITPFVGVRIADWFLGWWSAGGPGLVRIFGAVALLLGISVVYALTPTRRGAADSLPSAEA